MGAAGEKGETGAPRDHSYSHVGTPETESRLSPDGPFSGNRKFWGRRSRMVTTENSRGFGLPAEPQSCCRAPGGLASENSLVTARRPVQPRWFHQTLLPPLPTLRPAHSPFLGFWGSLSSTLRLLRQVQVTGQKTWRSHLRP